MFKQNTQNLDYNRAYQPCHTDCKFDENKKFYNLKKYFSKRKKSLLNT